VAAATGSRLGEIASTASLVSRSLSLPQREARLAAALAPRAAAGNFPDRGWDPESSRAAILSFPRAVRALSVDKGYFAETSRSAS